MRSQRVEGDKNTRFFHKMANVRARRNLLTKVRINGVIVIDDEEIKARVCRAYLTLLLEMGDWRLSIRGLDFEVLGEDRSISLEALFSKEEVFEALSSLFGDKAPGPDGFTMAFWHLCWDFTKPEIMTFFEEFFMHGMFQKSLNSTFLVLIPKRGVVSKNQQAFIQDR